MPRKSTRILIAICVAPAIVAFLFGIWCEVVLGWPEYMAPLYFIGSYTFGLPLAFFAIGLLHAFEWVRLWHFTAAGLFAGYAGVLYNYERLPEPTLVLIFIGAIVGACVWFISEWELPHPSDDS